MRANYSDQPSDNISMLRRVMLGCPKFAKSDFSPVIALNLRNNIMPKLQADRNALSVKK